MDTDEMDTERTEWLKRSRKLNPACGCDYRGNCWYSCSYHEGVIDAWEDAWGGGYTQGAKDHY